MIGGDAVRARARRRLSAPFLERRPTGRPGHDRAGRPAAAGPDLLRRSTPSAPVLYTPIDDKPKRSDDPMALARVRDILADPRVTVLVDRWDEDWTRLAWLRCDGPGRRSSSPAQPTSTAPRSPPFARSTRSTTTTASSAAADPDRARRATDGRDRAAGRRLASRALSGRGRPHCPSAAGSGSSSSPGGSRRR